MARPRSAGYDDQREAILAQAARLFAKRGYVGTSMHQVAEACGLSKATLYHYFKDKYSLLVSITEGHVSVLEQLVIEVQALKLPPEQQLRELIHRILQEYASAQDAHRVLTEDVRFLQDADRERVLGTERAVVAGFARALGEVHPRLQQALLATPLTMLLFGMINWMFTWMKPDGELGYAQMSPIVADLFMGGLPAVRTDALAKAEQAQSPSAHTP
jgi:AcrR family transcriptional regulator